MASLEERLETTTEEYQKLQKDLSAAVENRQRLDAQLTENEQVQKEFAQLKPANTVYKLIGPVLIKQEQSEAKQNVAKRLDFIKGEIKRAETRLKDLGEKAEKAKTEIVQLQTVRQAQQQQDATAVAS
ncbi:hypothetical protein M407DRAFT_244589 [Tulasnella calospora MUT 4182]|uniref:Prefoldin subunit 6 n=1 Tax=Tulasnella calospora MUT 4182 TaxID=1051891 RepID=A0A0C3Q4R2_9AGAM|nr:hypothetical protein M407DRAFT_244589 [Tulasnella calospora MUT 4182]